ncbi:hypothetical protein [Desulfocurvus sp. DL9XJH121]
MQRIVVESEAAYRYAAAQASQERVWLTTSPWLLDLLPREGETVVSLEAGVESCDEVVFGKIAMELAGAVADHLDSMETGDFKLGSAMYAALHMSCNPLLYKAWLLCRALAEGDLIIVGLPDMVLPRTLGCAAGRFDTLYAAIASRTVSGPEVWRFEDRSGDDQVKRMRSVGASLFERLIFLVNSRACSLWLRFVRKALGGKWPGLPGARLFLMGRQCELLEETAFALALRGCRLQLIDMPSEESEGAEIPQGFDAQGLETLLWERLKRICLDQGLPCGEVQRAALGAFMELLVEGLRHFLPTLHAVEGLASSVEVVGCDALLTNGLSAVSERLLFQALDRAGVTVVGFEHGLHDGLGTSSLYSVGNCSTLQSHGVVCLTPAAAEHFTRHGAEQQFAIAGAFGEVRRVKMRWLQRFFVSRQISVGRNEKVCMYVMTSNRNNVLQGPHGQIDKEFSLITSSVAKILHNSPYSALLKQYPSNRYLDPEPLEHRYADAGTTRVLQYMEYRYVRSCADVIVLDSAQSVLAWAWGTDRPLVFLQLPSDPLLPEARRAFEHAIFFIDLAESGWEEKLTELLWMPLEELQAKWKAKEERRQCVSEHFIMGPEGNSGARAAKAVLDWVGRKRLTTSHDKNGCPHGRA